MYRKQQKAMQKVKGKAKEIDELEKEMDIIMNKNEDLREEN